MATKTSSKTRAKNKHPKSPSKPEAASRSKDTSQKMSALDAAARVLGEKKGPMSCPELIETMAKKGYWKSPAGHTPSATLYAAIKREISLKKERSRFQQSAPGRFELA
jgi:hypothetical protein